jgi:multiple sugar transport system ATP-binding protein
MTLGSRIAVMKDGVLQQLGTPDDIYNRPANTYVATFIGSPTMNLVPGRTVAAEGRGFTITGADLPLACPAAANSHALMGLRPEHIVFGDNAPWRGEVSVVEPTGADTFVVVKTAAGSVTVRIAPHLRVVPGDRVGLDIQADHVNWFDESTGRRMG